MLSFCHKILVIGYGAVSKCTLPLLFKHIDIPFSHVTVLDFANISEDKQLNEWIQKGVRYVQERITLENLHTTLSAHVGTGGIIVDLAWNIDTLTMLRWCNEHNVLYLNTSVEEWDPFQNIQDKPILEKTLYWRQMNIRQAITSWKDDASTTIVDHGANPGLISHFTKQGLIDIARQALRDHFIPDTQISSVEMALDKQDFASLSMLLGVKVIHCSERDMQIVAEPKKINEFVNTWSIDGLIEEGLAPAELGWGTHEKILPHGAHLPTHGPKNQIFLPERGMNTWVRSWIPSQEIVGLLIRHGEAFGLSDRLTVWESDENEKAIYRPTVHYAYMPTDETICSLHELRTNNYEHPKHSRILSDEIIHGEDILGALIMGHPYRSWWTGSILSIHESRELVPNQNATTVQVAIGVVAALMWMIENPQSGFCLPEDLPHETILAVAKPYLGEFVSAPSDWTPQRESSVNINEETLWCFENFCYKP